MTIIPTRQALLRPARAVMAGAIVLLAVHGAAADDAGVHEFFTSMSPGGAGRPAAAAVDVSDRGIERAVERHPRTAEARPLTVHLHQPRILVAQGPTKPVTVSILEDRTLRAGDAVMTAKGVRIFAGSASWPYTAGDFVGLDTARHLGKGTSKVLAQLDRLPRG